MSDNRGSTPTRYPYTYSADWLRSKGNIKSRAEAASLATHMAGALGMDRGKMCEAFADAYIKEFHS